MPRELLNNFVTSSHPEERRLLNLKLQSISIKVRCPNMILKELTQISLRKTELLQRKHSNKLNKSVPKTTMNSPLKELLFKPLLKKSSSKKKDSTDL